MVMSQKFYAFVIICVMAVAWIAAFAAAPSTVNESTSTKNIALTTDNFYLLEGEINTGSVAPLISEIMTGTSPELIVYIKSPGGSVQDGLRLVDAIKSSKRRVVCIADIAISMATGIFHACTERVITPYSIIMQHQASFGISLQPERNFETYYNFTKRVINRLYQFQATRQKMTLSEFEDKIRDDWWIYGTDAFATNSADTLGNVTCSVELVKKQRTIKMQVLIFNVEVLMSACPLIEEPIGINAPAGAPENIRSQVLSKLNFRRPSTKGME